NSSTRPATTTDGSRLPETAHPLLRHRPAAPLERSEQPSPPCGSLTPPMPSQRGLRRESRVDNVSRMRSLYRPASDPSAIQPICPSNKRVEAALFGNKLAIVDRTIASRKTFTSGVIPSLVV